MKIITSLIALLFCTVAIAQEIESPAVLIVSDNIQQSEALAGAASDTVLVIRYKTGSTDLDQLFSMVKARLNGRKASSIAFATHDFGEAKFYLTGSETISLGSTLHDSRQRDFWQELGKLIAPEGRIDLLACNLARGEQGKMLIAALEDVSDVNFTASSNETGNRKSGGDWVMETDKIDISQYYFDSQRLESFACLLYAQRKKVQAQDHAVDDWFGTSVSISGDYAVVGAYREDQNGSDSGSAYVFGRNHGGSDNWGQVKKLVTSDGAAGDYFGYSVSISGEVVVVGAWCDDDDGDLSGSAYIFSQNAGGADNWGQVKKLTASDAADSCRFGKSVSVSGDNILVGSYTNGQGAAYVFSRNQGGADNWGEVKKLTGDHWFFGCSVSISGNTAIVGQQYTSGSAFIFDKDQGGIDNWGQVKKLTVTGGNAANFGRVVAISGDNLIVGAHLDSEKASHAGAAYIFSRNQGGADNWGQVQKLLAEDGATDDYFGYSVAINGDLALVGVEYEDGPGTNSGAAYVYARNQGGADNWGQLEKLEADDAAGSDKFGSAVSLDGDYIAVGAYWESRCGSLYIFQPEYHVTVNNVTNGNTDKDGDNIVFPGQSITIEATANQGYVFTSWSGDATGSTNPITISNVQADLDITPVFTRTYGTLQVSLAANGAGTSYSISGPSDFNDGTPLNSQTGSFNQSVPTGDYTVTFSENSFYNFSGNATSFNAVSYVLSGGLTVGATEVVSGVYTRATGTLNVVINDDGTGASYSISGPADFNGGSDLTGQTSNYSQVVPTGDYDITFSPVISHDLSFTTGSFVPSGYIASGFLANNVTESVTGSYSIKRYDVIVNPAALGHTDHDGTTSVNYGNDLSITATADYGSRFDSWTGDIASNDNPLLISNITRDYTVAPQFSKLYGSLKVTLNGTDEGSWRVRGKEQWLPGGAVVDDLYFGDVVVETMAVANFRRPRDTVVTIRGEAVHNISLTYTAFEQAPIMHYFTATPEDVCKGGEVTLSWQAVGANKVNISPEIGELDGDTGQKTVKIGETTTFTLKAKNADRTTVVTSKAEVAPKLEILEFSADRRLVHQEDAVQLKWQVRGAEKVVLINRGDKSKSLVSNQGQLQIYPLKTATYKLLATDSKGETAKKVLKVKVTEKAVINDFSCTTSSVVAGNSTTLRWDVAGADKVTIEPGIGAVPATGEIAVTPEAEITYTLTALNSENSCTEHLKIAVVEKAPDLILSLEEITHKGKEVSKPNVGEVTQVSVFVSNRGNSEARDVKVVLESETGSCDSAWLENISPGDREKVTLNWCAYTRGKNSLEIRVDPENTIGELDEKNNAIAKTLRAASTPGTDLIIDNVEVKLHEEGRIADVCFSVMNVGAEACDSFQYRAFFITAAKHSLSKAVAVVVDDYLNGLGAGEKISISRSVELPGATRKLYLHGLVDVHGAIAEVNKDNNSVIKRVK